MNKYYSRNQMILHWLTALFLAIAYISIEYRGLTVRGTWQRSLMIITHYSSGTCVMVFMLVRLYLKSVTPPFELTAFEGLARDYIKNYTYCSLHLIHNIALAGNIIKVPPWFRMVYFLDKHAFFICA